MAKGSDDVKMTLKLEGTSIGPIALNLEKTKTLAVAGKVLGLHSGTAGADGTADIILNRADYGGRCFTYIENTGTNAITVGLSPDNGSNYYPLGTLNADEFGMFPFSAATPANLSIKLFTASGTSTCNWGNFEMS